MRARVGDRVVEVVEQVALVGEAIERTDRLQDPEVLGPRTLHEHGDVSRLELLDDLPQGLRAGGVEVRVDAPTSPSTDVPVPERPRTTSLNGRPAASSTTVTIASTPTNTPAEATAIMAQVRLVGRAAATDRSAGRCAAGGGAIRATRCSEWLYTALPTTVSTLAERARMTKQAMAELVVGLERLGYVTRIPDPTDRRAKLVVLTDRGRDVIAVIRVRVPELERRIEDLLGSARARDLRDALASLRAAAGGWR